MKKSLVMLLAVLACSTAFAANKHEKSEPLPKSEHEVAVGTPKAADSGSSAENKAVKQEKTHVDKTSEKSEHDLVVGNEKASGSGKTVDDKTVKQDKTHANKGKHKAKGHDKK